MKSPDGTTLTFFVDDKTTYKGKVEGIRDLEQGMRAAVGGYEDQDGKLIARLVVAGNPQEDRPEIIKAQGTLKTVSPGAGKFQLEKSDGTVLTIYVNEKTTYRGQVNSFDDLKKGMRAGFGGYMDDDGKIIARVVVAGNPRQEDAERPTDVRPELDREDPDSGVGLEDLFQELDT